MPTVAAELLRDDLLCRTSVLVVTALVRDGEPSSEAIDGTPAESFGEAVRDVCERLGARVRSYAHEPAADEAAMDRTVLSAVAADTTTPAETGGIDLLAVDGAALFELDGLRACLDSAWDATRAVVNLAFLPAGRGGRIVYIAPAPGVGEQADAGRAGLENLARTLSIEWARHEITIVTIAPGDTSTPDEVGALTAYLASPAGSYFSGCLLDLRGI